MLKEGQNISLNKNWTYVSMYFCWKHTWKNCNHLALYHNHLALDRNYLALVILKICFEIFKIYVSTAALQFPVLNIYGSFSTSILGLSAAKEIHYMVNTTEIKMTKRCCGKGPSDARVSMTNFNNRTKYHPVDISITCWSEE